MSIAGCGVTPAVTHWQRLQSTPAAQVLADDESAVRTIRPIELPANGEYTAKIGPSDPVISNEGATSYAKLFRFLAKSPGTYEVSVDAECDCPSTAILWGTSDFPIFYPKIAVLDRAGKRLMATGDVQHLERIVIAAGTLLDGKGKVLHNTRIVIEEGKIVAIDPKAAPVDYDFRALTVLPGWIDAHAHVTWSFGPDGKNGGAGLYNSGGRVCRR